MLDFPVILFPHSHMPDRELKRLLSFFGPLTIFQPWLMERPVLSTATATDPPCRIARPPEEFQPDERLKALLAEYRNWVSERHDRSRVDFIKAVQGRGSTEGSTWEIRRILREGVEATPFGRRVSQLYIDPASAVVLQKALQKNMSPFGILHAVAACPDMSSLYLRRGDFEKYDLVAQEYTDQFLLDVPDSWEEPERYEIFLSEVKTAHLLHMWIKEVDEKEMCNHFGIGPGDVYRMRETADWLLYSFYEIARLFSAPQGPLRKLRTRLKYGIKEELLPLVKIRNIGRVRARTLYNEGFKTVKDVKSAPLPELTSVLGEGIAKSVKKQLTSDVD